MPRPRGSRLQLPHPLPDIPHFHRFAFTKLFFHAMARIEGKEWWGKHLADVCVLWPYYTDRKGYGQFRMGKRMHWAHRVSYALFVGPIPEGMTVNHKCRNPSCVNPYHLELLSVAENTALGNRHRTTSTDLPI